MKAPEKIYIDPEVDPMWDMDKRFHESDIEYTRTDAFVEKACKWLKDNITYIHPRKGTKECIVNLAKFKDYMKGE